MSPMVVPANAIKSINDNRYFMDYPPYVFLRQISSKYIFNNIGTDKDFNNVTRQMLQAFSNFRWCVDTVKISLAKEIYI